MTIKSKIKFSTLAVAELLFVDEMATDESRENQAIDRTKRRYGRNHPPALVGELREAVENGSDARASMIFLELPVLKADIESIVEAGKSQGMKIPAYIGLKPDEKNGESNINLQFVLVDDFENLEKVLKKNNRKVVVVSKLVEESSESAKLTQIIARELCDEYFRNIVVLGHKLNDKVGVMEIYEGSDIRLRANISSNVPFPVQEQILALLESGVSFLSYEKSDKSLDENTAEPAKFSLEELEERLNDCLDSFVVLEKSISDRYYRKKASIFAKNRNEEGFMKSHEEHVGNFFSINGRVADEVFLTRSGLSANNIIANAISKVSGQGTQAYFQVGWYYDNVDQIGKNFVIADEPTSADVLFINVDSSYPDEPEGYRKQQQEVIAEFMSKVNADGENKYYLVVDITTDMLWNGVVDIPDNLVLVKTFSATKHQRGGKNYFYGGVVSWNSENLKDEMEKIQDYFGGRITTAGVPHFPRFRRSEIRENMERLKLLTQAFDLGMEIGQSGLDEDEKLKTYSYSYYTYVAFPLKKELFPKKDLVLGGFGGEDDIDWEFGDLAEVGDSFGLDKTRVTFVPRSETSGEGSVRFSLGIKESEENAFKLGALVAEKWEKLLEMKRDEDRKKAEDMKN